ncbi:MAG: acyl-CoA dehydrogenase family protein [Alphaproteobacteria bacterium]|nr:acyl-CoA dehydrogenase family protein [Alphaproteobacteria bacterium]
MLCDPPPEAAPPTLEGWWSVHRALSAQADRPVDLALMAGYASDRLAWAFGSGYQAALRAAIPELSGDQPAALCASEAGGAHPRAIEARLTVTDDGLVLDGEKRFVTVGTAAAQLVVIARLGVRDDGRPRLGAVLVPSSAEGVRLTEGPPLSFVPELPHASLTLEAVALPAEALRPGDAYTTLLKPFRTIEDIHVHAAVLGHLLRVAAVSGWPAPWRERGLALACSLREIAALDPRRPQTHLALGGLLGLAEAWAAEAEPLWAASPPDLAARWRRDRALLNVANHARKLRLERARELLQ